MRCLHGSNIELDVFKTECTAVHVHGPASMTQAVVPNAQADLLTQDATVSRTT